ncbi:hypothetical protein COCVIDRAFT_115473 [Bipolaris victoriae FI3]|uniref:Uncharacterized protein n=1 Tax=Bipolaris victoriae (strain FI3) TaxID=930091 RepID=W7E4C7_BIPV3|nr:hypothetical protein COCVIDRAFT_115473 [Bipolaris victoriae FI3]
MSSLASIFSALDLRQSPGSSRITSLSPPSSHQLFEILSQQRTLEQSQRYGHLTTASHVTSCVYMTTYSRGLSRSYRGHKVRYISVLIAGQQRVASVAS